MLRINFLSAIIFFCLLVTSCKSNNNNEYEFVNGTLLPKWTFTYEFNFSRPEYNQVDFEVVSPPSTWQRIFSLKFLSSNSELRKHCVFYRVPLKNDRFNKLGILRVVEVDINKNCKVQYNNADFLEIVEIERLRITYRNRKLILKIKKIGGNKKYSFLFLNIVRDEKFKRYSSSGKNYSLPSTLIAPGDFKQIIGLKDYIGESEDNYPERSMKTCHQMDENCNPIVEYQCDLCKLGWFNVIGSKCSSVLTKLCGDNRCGEKGWPACIKGYEYMGIDTSSKCIPNHPSGFCNKGLTSHCDENGILICL